MIKASDIIHLSPRAFWDVDMNTLDYDGKANYIIRKVFDNGSLDDILETIAYYGTPKIITTLLAAPYLKESTQYFSSLLFNIPLQQFTCYNIRQFHPVQ
jgi:hypothetical protein